MNWQNYRLGEFISIKHGWAFKGEYFSSEGNHLLLTPGNAYEQGGLKIRSGKEKFYTGEFPPEFLLKKDDIVVIMTDLVQAAPILGGAIKIPKDDYFLHNQRLGLVEFKSDKPISKNFLYYLLNSPCYRAQIRGSATGATVRHTAPQRIYDCSILIPVSIEEQNAIANILMQYDLLIENNRKRIALLEESARLLYQEWFVKFRFPDCKIGDKGFPDGWTMCSLSDLVTLHYGKSLKESAREDGDIPVFGSSGIVGRHNKFLVKGPSIIVGRKGNVGSVYYTAEDCFAIDTVYFIKSEEVTFYNFFLLQSQDFVSSDTAVPGLNRNYAYSLNVLKPAQTILKKFEDMVAPMFEQIQILSISIDKLQKARDELLPKLISGKIKV